MARSYLAALVAPFSRDAIGAQVPDLYSFPTETQMIRCEFTIGTDNQGNCDFVVQPSLWQTLICNCPATAGGVSPNSSPANLGGVYNAEFSPGTLGVVTPTSTTSWSAVGVLGATINGPLAQQMQRYRIVGWGTRLRCLVAPLSQQGRVILATLPSARLSFPSGLAGNAAGVSNSTNAIAYTFMDLPTPGAEGYMTTEILNVPESMECMLSDLAIKGGIEFVGKPTASGNISFRDSFNDVALTSSLSLGEVATGNLSSGAITTVQLAATSTITVAGNSITFASIGGNISYGAGTAVVPVGAFMTSALQNTFFGIATVGAVTCTGTVGLVTSWSAPVLVAVPSQAQVYFFTGVSSTGSVLDPDYYRIDGWETLAMRGIGLPINQKAVMSLEVIFHVEGCPFVSGTVGAFVNGGEAPPIDPGLYQAAAQAACEMPYYRSFQDTLGPTAAAMFARVGRSM